MSAGDGWQPISTAPRNPDVYLLGFDEITAELFGDRAAGLCLIRWVEADEEYDDWAEDWEVLPFSNCLDVVLSETRITHWQPLPDAPAKESLS